MAGMAAKDVLGRRGEDRAAAYLEAAGLRVIERNWRVRAGEIDIVACGADSVVIVEVKTRRSERFGHPFEAIDSRKQRRLWALACAWAKAHPDLCRGKTVRVDAIALTGPNPRTARLEHLEAIA